MLLASGLGGLSQVVARYWLHSDRSVPRDQAVQLLTSLAWRGIAGFPLHGSGRSTDSPPRPTAGSTVVPARCSLLAFSGGAWTSPHRANVCCVRRGWPRTSLTVGGT